MAGSMGDSGASKVEVATGGGGGGGRRSTAGSGKRSGSFGGSGAFAGVFQSKSRALEANDVKPGFSVFVEVCWGAAAGAITGRGAGAGVRSWVGVGTWPRSRRDGITFCLSRKSSMEMFSSIGLGLDGLRILPP